MKKSPTPRGGGPIVLLVASPAEERALLGAWMEEEGLDVMTCPGPRGPGPCVGMRGHCVLAEAADAVVVDMHLADDELTEGFPAWQLLDVYLGLGVGIVALVEPGDVHLVEGRGAVVSVPRPPDRAALLGAVGAVLAG